MTAGRHFHAKQRGTFGRFKIETRVCTGFLMIPLLLDMAAESR